MKYFLLSTCGCFKVGNLFLFVVMEMRWLRAESLHKDMQKIELIYLYKQEQEATEEINLFINELR